MMKYAFPTLIIVISICAGATYFHYGEYKKALYWFSAPTLNIAVTY